MAKFPVNSGYF